jgi:hypothetical protein
MWRAMVHFAAESGVGTISYDAPNWSTTLSMPTFVPVTLKASSAKFCGSAMSTSGVSRSGSTKRREIERSVAVIS